MIVLMDCTVLSDALRALKDDNIHHCDPLGFTCDEMNAFNFFFGKFTPEARRLELPGGTCT
ncbi:hypothetical protein EAH77_20345 [Ewingella americana]|uniref:Uncharacterized protein n=1 Tax=Ewingella americana TaxID=41202 RepID=A0A502G6S7_9GAMM|nr:hypothetical protein EAH77_20345 [Ewingella americana]